MNTRFVTLPSGTRINVAHLIHFKQSEHEGQIHLILTDEPTPWLETMTLEQLDALLHPPQSPIVSPVLDLDRLKPGTACQFTYEGLVRHGVIHSMDGGSFEPNIYITSHGQSFLLMPQSGICELQ
jgi:hypothetical protein